MVQRHTPSTQVPPVHATPQPPQLLLSLSSATQVPEQRVCTPGHGATQMLLLHVCPAGQTVPHAPQLVGDTRVSISHPSAAERLQSEKPVAQVIEQAPEVQRGVDWGPATQALRHAPQLSVSALRSDSQPLVTLPSQSPRAPAHIDVQMPRMHVPAPHERPHAPQLVLVVSVFTSQPLLAMPSQSAKPGAHASMVHAPAAHPCVATLVSRHALPQAPQWSALVAVDVSQPVLGSLSQSPKPALQLAMVHALIAHADVALRRAQARPQVPQFVESARMSASQPSLAMPLQSAVPSAHAMPQRPIAQVPTPPSPAGHTLPHAPQLFGSVCVFTSQPLAAFMSQFS
jgi:hypothetical protein